MPQSMLQKFEELDWNFFERSTQLVTFVEQHKDQLPPLDVVLELKTVSRLKQEHIIIDHFYGSVIIRAHRIAKWKIVSWRIWKQTELLNRNEFLSLTT